jgi:hypothetical protein
MIHLYCTYIYAIFCVYVEIPFNTIFTVLHSYAQKPSKQINHVSWGHYQYKICMMTCYQYLLVNIITIKIQHSSIYKFTQPGILDVTNF